jgi:hypothetical protein
VPALPPTRGHPLPPPQARQPFDERTRAYISRLDAERDVEVLRAHGLGLRSDCLRVLRVSTMLLKKAAARGLSPYQIACIMTRQVRAVGALHPHPHPALIAAFPSPLLASAAPARAARRCRQLTPSPPRYPPQSFGKSPLEKLHSHAAQLAGRSSVPGTGSAAYDEAAYLHHMARLLDELVEDSLLDPSELLL